MRKQLIIAASCFGLTATVLGAMGAHALKPLLQTEQLQTFETAVRYQMYHAFALLFLAALEDKLNPKFVRWAFYTFLLGVFLFSGSLYLLSIHSLIGLENYKWLGPITPLGGLCFILGWGFMLQAALKSEHN